MNDFMGAISDYDKMIEGSNANADNYKKRGIFKLTSRILQVQKRI